MVNEGYRYSRRHQTFFNMTLPKIPNTYFWSTISGARPEVDTGSEEIKLAALHYMKKN